MKNQVSNPGDKHLHYNIKKLKNQGSCDIIHDISDNFTLVQLMDTVVNVNYVVSIVGYCIFDPNYKFSLLLKIYSLNHICSPLVGEGIFSIFETVFYVVIYINNRVKLNIFG